MTPDPRNPNRMSAPDKARMDGALAEFGDLGGIVLNRRTGLLVGGHQRIDVMTDAQIDVSDLPEPEADGTVARGWLTYKGNRFAVRVVDWDDDKAHAAMLAANRFGRVGSDDDEALKSLLDELATNDYNLELTGFDADSLAEMLSDSSPETESDAEPQIDRAEELNEKWNVKPGDLWLIGEHRLLCGDSTKVEDVGRVMAGEKVSLCFTSPPYNAGKYTLTGNVVKKDKTSRYAGQTDDRSEDDYVSFLCEFTDAALTHCELVAVNIQQLANNKHAVLKWVARYADHFVDRAVWYKGRGNPAFAPSVMDSRFEDIWIWSPREKPKRTITTADFRGTVPNVVESTGASAENDNAETHAATMPMAVCAYAVKSWTRDGASVYDPFLGSGTTMVAAQNLGRKVYGLEIAPNYCAVILERMIAAFPKIDIRRGDK